MGRRKKPFLVLELSEAEARALLHAAELALVVSGKGDRVESVRLGMRHFPHTAGEVSSVGRVVNRLRPSFRNGCWYGHLAGEVSDDAGGAS